MGAALPKRRSDPNSLLQQSPQPGTVTHDPDKVELRPRCEPNGRRPELRMLQSPDHPSANPKARTEPSPGPDDVSVPADMPTSAQMRCRPPKNTIAAASLDCIVDLLFPSRPMGRLNPPSTAAPKTVLHAKSQRVRGFLSHPQTGVNILRLFFTLVRPKPWSGADHFCMQIGPMGPRGRFRPRITHRKTAGSRCKGSVAQFGSAAADSGPTGLVGFRRFGGD